MNVPGIQHETPVPRGAARRLLRTTFHDVNFNVGALALDAGSYLLSFYGLDLEFRTANTADPAGVPEPSSLLVSGIALAALAFHRRRRRPRPRP